MENNKAKVCIAIPTKSGNIYFELALRLLEWTNQEDLAVMIMFETFSAPIDHARNMIVKRFLNTNCTHLMMIDDDIVPPANTLKQLLHHDKDIIAAVCPLIGPDKKHKLVTKYNAYAYLADGTLMNLKDAKGLLPVDAIGTGCCLIKREVLENVKPAFMTQYNKETGIKYRGEDIHFCKEASNLGVEIYADFNLKCKHIKQCNLLEL